jgi:hypothetical protein
VKKERKHYSAEEKVAILRRHLLFARDCMEQNPLVQRNQHCVNTNGCAFPELGQWSASRCNSLARSEKQASSRIE